MLCCRRWRARSRRSCCSQRQRQRTALAPVPVPVAVAAIGGRQARPRCCPSRSRLRRRPTRSPLQTAAHCPATTSTLTPGALVESSSCHLHLPALALALDLVPVHCARPLPRIHHSRCLHTRCAGAATNELLELDRLLRAFALSARRYVAEMTRDQAKDILDPLPSGTFLVRGSNKGGLALSIKCAALLVLLESPSLYCAIALLFMRRYKDTVKHIKIQKDDSSGQYFLSDLQFFKTIPVSFAYFRTFCHS